MQKNVLMGLVVVLFMLIVGVTLTATRAGDIAGGGSENPTTTATVDNAAPVVETLNFSTSAYGADNLTSTGILPTIGMDRTIHVTGVLSDASGESDIASTSLVLFRSGVTDQCSSDKNSCYIVPTCALDSAYGNATEVAYDCPVDLAYWTDATDGGGRYPTQTWRGQVLVTDLSSATSSLQEDIEVNSLLALNIPDEIAYGTRSLGEQSTATSDIEMILTQKGNTAADVEVSGTAMSCSILGQIPVGNQGWSLTSVDYQDAEPLSGTPADTDRNIGYRDNDSVALAASLYWSIKIPVSNVKGLCTGANTVSVVANPMPEGGGGPVTAFRVAASPKRSFLVTDQGDLWAWGGYGSFMGQHSNNFTRNASTTTEWWTMNDGMNDSEIYAVRNTGAMYSVTGDVLNLALRADISGASEVWTSSDSVIALKTDGTLWARGYNGTGILGLGDNSNRVNFTQIGTDTNWATADIGPNHAAAVRTNGTLWSWGQNFTGQLGLGDNTDHNSPQQVGSDTNWSKVSIGQDFTIALKTDGTLWSWGENSGGQLGLGNTTVQTSPQQIGSDTWVKVSAGSSHVLAIRSDGTLWSWGLNFSGQLGLGDHTDHTSPVQIGTDTDWVDIAAGGAHSLALKSDHTTWAWGANTMGEVDPGLGFSDKVSPLQVFVQ